MSLELLSRKLGEGSVGSTVAVRPVPVMTTTAFPICPGQRWASKMFKNRNWRQRRRGEGLLDRILSGVAVSSLVWSVGRCPGYADLAGLVALVPALKVNEHKGTRYVTTRFP